MIRTNTYQIRFSASQGFVWFWVVLAHESVVKMSARLPSSEGVTGAGIFASKMLLAGGLGSTPRGSRLLICLQDQGAGFLQNKRSKKEQGRTFMVACHSFFFHQFDFYHHQLLLLFLNFIQIESSFVWFLSLNIMSVKTHPHHLQQQFISFCFVLFLSLGHIPWYKNPTADI